jgi:hypothetical protein
VAELNPRKTQYLWKFNEVNHTTYIQEIKEKSLATNKLQYGPSAQLKLNFC